MTMFESKEKAEDTVIKPEVKPVVKNESTAGLPEGELDYMNPIK